MLWGERDLILSVAVGQRLASRIGHRIDHVIPDAGHGLQEDQGPMVGEADLGVAAWRRLARTPARCPDYCSRVNASVRAGARLMLARDEDEHPEPEMEPRLLCALSSALHAAVEKDVGVRPRP
jgi:hypothetical protein